jgi:ATP-dependent RNA helicase DDX24/MAK5
MQGSGKTLAFGLPILDLVCQAQPPASDTTDATDKTAPSPLRALILAPTRELAMQVCTHLQAVGRHCGVWVVPIVGGISAQKQERLLSKKPQVIVATPGRLWDLMREGHTHVANLGGLQFLVIDEADRMVQQGHYAELSSILDAIPGVRAAAVARGQKGNLDDEEEYQDPDEVFAPSESEEEDEEESKSAKKKKASEQAVGKKVLKGPQLQTFVFSATLTLPGDMRKRLRKGGGGASGSATLESLMDKVPLLGQGKPKIVDLTSDRKVADKISEACISCAETERDEYLYCLLASHPGRTIVFVNAISAVRRLAAILKLLGLPIYALHAGMQQRARLKALDRFRDDSNAILVATDVAARGLDVKDVRCVVHYQLPASLDVYVHRSGRTARADADGIAIALVTPKEDARYRALLRALGREEPPAFPLDASLMAGSRERVRLAVKLDSLDRKLSKERADFSWRKQNAEEIGIVLSDDSDDEMVLVKGKRLGKKARKERDDGTQPVGYREIEKIRGDLNSMLAEPLQPKFSKKFFTGGAAGGVALQQQEQQEGGSGGSAGNTKGGKNGVDNEEGKNRDTVMTATTSKAVFMAQQLSDSRAKANKINKAPSTNNKNGNKKKQTTRAEALAAAIRKQAEKKAMKGTQKRGMVVVSSAMGRNTKGPDALEALRARFGTTAAAVDENHKGPIKKTYGL